MTSQSPLRLSQDESTTPQTSRYLNSWQAIGTLLRDGRSWSGNERNSCFLNTGTDRFADVAFVAGLDQASDSRAVAAVDWDQDGDLDLWISNRTSPRVRLLRNNSSHSNHFIALRLQGVRSNRDAIGARVDLFTDASSDQPESTATVRAGEGYLAQGSKVVHVGIGDRRAIDKMTVTWPSGEVDEFRDVQADLFYRLVESSGQLEHQQVDRPSIQLGAASPTIEARTEGLRIVAHRRLPLPELPYLTFQGQATRVSESANRFRLVVLWTTWCQPCLHELLDLSRHRSSLDAAQISVTPINVNDVNDEFEVRRTKAEEIFAKLNLEAWGGLADTATLDLLDAAQRSLTTKHDPLPVPCSFLLDPIGRLMICYKGPVVASQVIDDVQQHSRELDDPRNSAIPIAGRWFTNPFPPDLMAIPRELIDIDRPREALQYVRQHIAIIEDQGESPSLPLGINAPAMTNVLSRIGIMLAKQRDVPEAIEAFRLATRYQPNDWNAHAALATLLQQHGQVGEALAEHRETLRLQPNHPIAANNIAWILATNENASIRDPLQAIQQAERVCRMTQFQSPETLDTLAAAFASAGRFDEAVTMAKRAIQLARKNHKQSTAQRIETRLKLYESKQPFIERKQ